MSTVPVDPILLRIAEAICADKGLTLGAMVGEGAFKQTFVVKEAGGKRLALKVFRQVGESPRTEREFAAMLTCNHPNIVSLVELDRCDVDGRSVVYCLEEFLPGDTLSVRLQRGRLTRSDTLALAHALIPAVEHIASHSLVHRDIKPDNILFRSDGTPVVVDFGIVRDLVRSPVTASWVLQGPGTPFFASPEQLNNQRAMIDWRTDQFALGVTLFLSRFGFHPYGESNQPPEEVIPLVGERRGPSEVAVSEANTDDLGLLLKMLEPWPVGRFRRPQDLAIAWGQLEG